MIEVRELPRPDENGSNTEASLALFLDGEHLPEDVARVLVRRKETESKPVQYEVVLEDVSILDAFARHQWKDIPDSVTVLLFPKVTDENGFVSRVHVSPVRFGRDLGYSAVSSLLYVDDVQKVGDWEAESILRELSAVARSQGCKVDIHFDPTRLYIDYPPSLGHIEDEIRSSLESVRLNTAEICNRALGLFNAADAKSTAVSVRFDFPEAVKVPCEQYLLFFAEFLKDIGLQATADLKHDTSGVLFTVTPTDKDAALDNIWEALRLYLHLPNNPSLVLTPVYNESIEVQKLAANVMHLHSQLILAKSALQLQQAENRLNEVTIQTLQNANTMVNALSQQPAPLPAITNNVMVDSIVPSKDKDREPIFGGMIVLTEYEVIGFNVNLAEVYRRGKRKIAEMKERNARDEPSKPGE